MVRRYTRTAQLFTGIITVLQAMAFTGILCLAGGQLFKAFFGWNVSYGILFTAIFVGSYTAIGGMNAVIKTDILQFWIIVGGAILTVLGAILLLTNNSAAVRAEWFWRPDWKEFNIRSMLALGAGYFLGEAFLPMYSIRALIGGVGKSVRRAFIAFGCGIVIYYAAMMLVGVAGNTLQVSGTGTNMVFVNVLSSLGGDTWVRWLLAGVSMTALLGLTHSTLDSVLNAGASSFARDIVGAFFTVSDAQMKGYMKRSLIVISLLGTIFSLTSNDLIDILMIGYNVWVPTAVFPFAYVLLRGDRVRSRHSATFGMLAGVAGFFVTSRFPELPIPPILTGFLANAVTFMVCEFSASPRQQVQHG